jgi:hypothetical protein
MEFSQLREFFFHAKYWAWTEGANWRARGSHSGAIPDLLQQDSDERVD